jgi:hypothetical protein
VLAGVGAVDYYPAAILCFLLPWLVIFSDDLFGVEYVLLLR